MYVPFQLDPSTSDEGDFFKVVARLGAERDARQDDAGTSTCICRESEVDEVEPAEAGKPARE